MSGATSTPSARGVPRELVLVEDNPGDARLVRELLKVEWTRRLVVHHFETIAEATAHLERHGADCVLLDLTLPDARELEGLTEIHSRFPRLPIVIMSGTDHAGLTLRSLHEGAQDYLVKGQVDGRTISRSIRYAVERKRVENDAQASGEAARLTYRLATGGVALALVLLAGFSLWAATVTKTSADALEVSAGLSDAYGQAIEATNRQDRTAAEYALAASATPGAAPALRREHRQAAESLTSALDGIELLGDTADRQRSERARAAHAAYLSDAESLFSAVDAGLPLTALAERRRSLDAAFAETEEELSTAAADHREVTASRVSTLSRTDDAIFIATLVAFSVGLLLLALFGGVVRAYRRRFERARRAELARRERSTSPPGAAPPARGAAANA